MAIKLPTEIQEPVYDINRITMVIYGAPKIGKSTFCSRFENALFMATEPGLDYLRTKNVRVHDWAEVLELVDILEKQRGAGYKTLIVDTVDQLWAFVEEYVRRSRKVESLVDLPFGKGRDVAASLFGDLVNRIMRLDLGVVFVSHAQMADVDTVSGRVSRFLPTIPERARVVILPLVDVIGFATVDTSYESGERVEKRLLRVAPSPVWEAGDRSGRLVDPMPLNFHIFRAQYEGKTKEKAE